MARTAHAIPLHRSYVAQCRTHNGSLNRFPVFSRDGFSWEITERALDDLTSRLHSTRRVDPRIRLASLPSHAQPLADDALPEPDEGERLADGPAVRTARAGAVREQPDHRTACSGAANVQRRPLEL
eukprot:scaffold85949_cov69-Phaeocystis_antarctica.AAC.3